jgi:hypothetical protein
MTTDRRLMAIIAGHARAILDITAAEGTAMPDETELWIAGLEAAARKLREDSPERVI